MAKLDLIGQQYGRLVVQSEEPSVNYRRFFLCECSCGNTTKVSMSHLRTGHTQSCGCLFIENPPRLVHGYNRKNSQHPLYHIWAQMLGRCNSPTNSSYFKYGAKGIKVCKEWHNPKVFIDWAMFNGYQKGLTLDRVNVYRDYNPNNCRWVSTQIQAINKRLSKLNVSGFSGVSLKKGRWLARITVDGVRIHLGYFSSALDANAARIDYIKSNNLTEHLNAYSNQQNNKTVNRKN